MGPFLVNLRCMIQVYIKVTPLFFAAMYRGTTSKAGRTRARKETAKKQDFENNDDESWKQYLVDDIKSEEESSSAALRLILATLDSLKKGGYDIFSAQE